MEPDSKPLQNIHTQVLLTPKNQRWHFDDLNSTFMFDLYSLSPSVTCTKYPGVVITWPGQEMTKTSPDNEVTTGLCGAVRYTCTSASQFVECIDLRLCLCVRQCAFPRPLVQLWSVGAEAGVHTAVWGSTLIGRLWWTTIYNNIKLRRARHDAPPGGVSPELSPEPSWFRPRLCWSKLFYRLMVLRLFISTRWGCSPPVCWRTFQRVCCLSRAASVLMSSPRLSSKIGSGLERHNTARTRFQ